MLLPPECKQILPYNASITSGGVTNISKLEKDIERIDRTGKVAEKELNELIAYVDAHPPPLDLFPELEVNRLHDRLMHLQ